MPRAQGVAETIIEDLTADPAYVDGDLVIAVPGPHGDLYVIWADGRPCAHLTARDVTPYAQDGPTDTYRAVEDLFTDRDHDLTRLSDVTREWTQAVTSEPRLLGMDFVDVHETSPDLRRNVMTVTFDAKATQWDEASYVDVDIPLTTCQDAEGMTAAVNDALRRQGAPEPADDNLPL